MIRAIVCVDKNWGIGKNNGLLFSIPEDMKFFRETTTGATVCMGRKTLLSFPNGKPLKNRKNVVLCSAGFERDDCACVHDEESLFSELKKSEGDVYVIGGGRFYKTMLPYCEEVLVTKVDHDGGADVFFPNLDKDPDFALVNCGEEQKSGDLVFRFTKYKNNNFIKI